MSQKENNSKVVEERVVQMTFDNAQFERNTKQTMSTLDKLKAKLNFTDSAKSLDTFNQASKKFNLDGVSAAVQDCTQKLDFWYISGKRAIENLTDIAMNAGMKITKALTVEPVFTGFSEYETKINAVQTIMANVSSKGKSLEEVNEVLDELNLYADKTIYNFAQMTKNIGTFTAAGVDLQVSADAIQGISNLAASTGSNAQQASTAMYQLSQALAAGALKLQDWNSVVNAGMGGEMFQEGLKQTAKEFGIDVDSMIEKAGSFRESLKEGWITTDVLTTTLNKFTVKGAEEYAQRMLESGQYTMEQAEALKEQAAMMEDAATKVKTFTQLWDTLKESAQSGWTETWQLLIGDFEEAKDFLSNLNDRFSSVINVFSEARNNLLRGALSNQGSWDQFYTRLENAGVATDLFKDKVVELAKADGVNFDELADKYETFDEIMRSGEVSSDYLRKALKELSKESEELRDTTGRSADRLGYFQQMVDEVWRGDWDAGVARIEKLTAANHDYEAIQELVNKTVDGHRLALTELGAAQMRATGYTEEEIKSIQRLAKEAEEGGGELSDLIDMMSLPDGRTLIIETVYNTLDAIGNICHSVGEAFKTAFDPLTSADLFGVIYWINQLSAKLLAFTEENMEPLTRTLSGVFAMLSAVKYIMSSGIRLALNIISALLGNLNFTLMDATATIGDYLVILADWIKEHDIVNTVMEKIGPTLVIVGDKIRALMDLLRDSEGLPQKLLSGLTTGVGFTVGAIWELINQVLSGAGGFIIDYFSKMDMSGISAVFDKLFKTIKDKLKSLFTDGISFASSATAFMKNFIANLGDAVKNLGPKVIEKIKEVYENIKTWIKDNFDPGQIMGAAFILSVFRILDRISSLAEAFSSPFEALGGLFESLTGVIEDLGDVLVGVKIKLIASSVTSLAISLALLGGVIWLLGTQLSGSEIIKANAAIWSLGLLIGGLMALSIVLSNVANVAGGVNWALILSIAHGLLVMSASLFLLSKIKTNELGTAIVGMSAIVIALIVLMKQMKIAMTLGDAKSILALSVFLQSFAGAMMLLVGVVKLTTMMSMNEIGRGLTFMLGCEVLITGFIGITRLVGRGSIKHAGKAMLEITASMLLIIGIVKLAAGLGIKETAKAVVVLGEILGLIALVLLVTKIGGEAKSGFALMKVVGAIAVMALVVRLLGNIGDRETHKALNIIERISNIFMKLIAASLFGGEHAGKFGIMMLSLSGSILLLTGAIWALGNIKMSHIIKGELAVTALIFLLRMIIQSTKDATDVSKTVIMIGMAMLAIAAAVIALSFIDIKKLAPAVAAMILLMGGFAYILKMAKGLNESSLKKVFKVMTMVGLIAGMAFGLAYMLTAIHDGKFADKAIGLGALIAALGYAAAMMARHATKFAKMATTKMALLGVIEVMAIMLAVMAIAAVILYMAGDTNTDLTTVAGIVILFAALTGAAVAITRFGNTVSIKEATGLAILLGALGAVMLILSAVLRIIGAANVEGVIPKVGALSILMGALTVCAIAITKLANTEFDPKNNGMLMRTLGTIIFLGVIAAGLSKYVMEPLSSVESGGLLTKIGGLVILLAAISACSLAITKMSKDAGNWEDWGKAVLSMVILSIIAHVLVELVMKPMSEIDVGGLLTKITALSELMGVLTLCTIAIEKFGKGASFGNMITALVGIALLGVIAAGIVHFIMIPMNEVDVSGLVSKMRSLEEFLGVLTICSGVLGGIGMLGPNALWGAVLLLAVGVVLEGLIWLFNQFIGPQLPALGANIAGFGMNILPFVAVMKSIDETAINGCKAISDMLMTLFTASMLDILTQILTFGQRGMFDSMEDVLTGLGHAVVALNDIIAGKIDPEAVNSAALIGNMLAALYDTIPREGGLLNFDWLLGSKNIGDFGDDLAAFAEGITAFAGKCTGVNGVDKSKVEQVCDAAIVIIEMAKQIPNGGGLWGAIAGNNDLDKFGEKMSAFAQSIVDFNDTIKEQDIKAENFQSMVDAVKLVIDIAQVIPNNGGLLGKVFGNNDIDEWSSKLPDFATNVKDFATNASGITLKSEDIAPMLECVGMIIEMSKNIDNDGGVLGWLLGENDLKSFGEQLKDFGGSLVAFNDTITAEGVNLDTGAFKKAVSCTESMTAVMDAMPETTLIDALIGTDEIKIKSFKKIAPLLAEVVNEFATALSEGTITEADANKSKYLATVTESLKTMSTQMPTQEEMDTVIDGGKVIVNNKTTMVNLGKALTEYSKSMQNLDEGHLSAGLTGLNMIVSALTGLSGVDFSKVDSFKESLGKVGSDVCQKFADAFDGSYDKIQTSVNGLVDTAEQIFKNRSYLWKVYGKRIPDGLKDAITEKQEDVKIALTNMMIYAGNAITGQKNWFKILGMNTMYGLIDGIYEKRWEVENAARDVANSAANVMREALKINSPSRVMREIGEYTGMGFVNGLNAYVATAEESGVDMAEGVQDSINYIISEIYDAFENRDLTPTITPVLDLTNVTSDLDTFRAAIGGTPIGVATTSMANEDISRDILDVLTQLNKKIDDMGGDTYNFGNIEYSDDSNISNAVKQLVNAVSVARRT